MNNPFFKIDERILTLAGRAEERCRPVFEEIDRRAEYNAMKVLSAFGEHRVSESHFAGSTGYGYGDIGRDTLDAVFAQIVGAEDALVRHNFVSGTHALTTALFGVLRPGDVLLSLTGAPYDTMEEVIGIRGEGSGSLKDFGVHYRQLDLLPDGTPDYAAIPEAVKGVKVAYIQRSRGYSLRDSLSIAHIEEIAKLVKQGNPDAILMVDNCYGEFVEETEPTQHGADLTAGSLIKNPGGGLAPTGGYIAGRADLVERAAFRLTVPGIGGECGATLGVNRSLYQGLFMAPHTVCQALKTAVFAAALLEEMGFSVSPGSGEERHDIIQTVDFGKPEPLLAFCRGIQAGAPVDSFAAPEPWDMPGYDCPVVMAAGAFIQGSSIELSCDAPMREPYTAFLQGGLTYEAGRLGVMAGAKYILEMEK